MDLSVKKRIITEKVNTLPDKLLDEVISYLEFLKFQHSNNELEQANNIHLKSETTLVKDWLLKEEDEAWKDL